MKIKSQEQIELEEKERIEAEQKENDTDQEYNKSIKQKIQHFWRYEKWKIIIPLLAFVIIVSLVRSYLDETRELTLCIAMVNARMDSSDDVVFDDRFASTLEIDLEAYPIRVETGLIQPEVVDATVAADTTIVASIQRYRNMLLSGGVDITITNQWVIDEYEAGNAYMNLKEVLPDELYKKFEEDIVYSKNMDGEEIPVGIRIKDYADINGFYDKEPILVISAKTQRLETTLQFIEWLDKEMSLR